MSEACQEEERLFKTKVMGGGRRRRRIWEGESLLSGRNSGTTPWSHTHTHRERERERERERSFVDKRER
jgi:hypothetical protein